MSRTFVSLCYVFQKEVSMATPQQIAAKWKRSSIAAKSSMLEGINNVTESPTAAAARKVDKYAAGCQKAVEDGTFVAGCKSVTLPMWQESMRNKGIPNHERGVTLAENKVADFQTQFQPFVTAAAQTVNNMPDSTESDREEKMLAMIRKLRTFKYQKRVA